MSTTPTLGQIAAQKIRDGHIISARELLAMTPYDMDLDCVPDCWPDGIKSFGDLQDRIRYETDEDGIEWLVIRLRRPYRIEADRIDTVPRLFWWIAHLCEKTWMTREAFSVLIETVTERNGIKWGEAT